MTKSFKHNKSLNFVDKNDVNRKSRLGINTMEVTHFFSQMKSNFGRNFFMQALKKYSKFYNGCEIKG